MRFIYKYLIAILLIFISFQGSFGEGTKEIYPVGGGFYKLYLSPSDPVRNRFALYTATEPERLNITILNPNEVIFFGFNDGANTNNFKFRIKDASGTVVYPETQVPTSGQGYIATLAQARNGPSSLFAGGYSPRRYIAPAAGVYYMEFTTGGGDKEFEYFDITVSNPDSTAAIYGRVWSKGWQCTTTDGSSQCAAKFYAYSDDQIVTAVNFNGMRPYAFDISCNSTGCNNTGNFIEDRKSRPGRHLYPQYKLFLNNPDSVAFPTGVLGQIDSVNYTSHCNGTVDFKIWVNKDGSAEILLDIYAPVGYSSGDVKLPGQVLAGTQGNIFIWDGKDGNGVDVLNGTTFFVTTSYLNGLTHLPLYDSEYNLDYNPNWQGYLVSLIRPTGPQPALYWNDSLCGGGSNFAGCTNPIGCHAWGYNVGNEKTINTWWYAVSTSSVPIILLKKIHMTFDSTLSICNGDSVLINGIYRKVGGDYTILHTSVLTGCDSNTVVHLTIDPTPVVELGPDVWICEGQTFTFDAGAGSGYIYQWDNLTTSTPNIGSNQTYTTGVAGFYKVTVTTNKGCHKSDSVHLYINPKPHLTNNPFSDTICSTFPFNITLTSNVPGTTFSWVASLVSGNITGFSNGAGNIINQTLTNNNPTSGKIQYTISSIVGGCSGNDTNYFVVVKPKPNVTTNPLTYQICSSTMTSINLTSAVAGATFSWTATGSSGSINGFSDGTGNNIQQMLTNSSFINQTVTYHVVAHAEGCNGDTTAIIVTVFPKPDLSNNPASAQICNKTSPNVTLTSNVTGAMFTWRVTGTTNVTGFSDNSTPTTILNQTLTNSSNTNGTVTYRILPWIGGCSGDSTSFIVTVFPIPDLSNSPATKQICNNTFTNITLTSNVTGTLFTWTATGSSGQVSGFSDNSIPTALLNQTLVNSGFMIETVTYYLTPHANGCSGNVTDYVVTVYPVPDLSNNPLFMQVCNNTPTNQTLTSDVAGTLFTWTATGSSPLVSGYSDNAIPTVFLNQTLVNAGLNPEYVTYHITPHANGCDGPVTDYVVTVVSSPDVYFNPLAQTICSQQTSSIQVLSHVPGTTFTWTTSSSSPNLSGYSNSAGNMIAQTVTNSGITIETVTYTVTPTAGGCPPGAPQNVVLTVNPKPAVTNMVTSFQQCSATTTNIVPLSSVPGSSFTWTATGSSILVSGFSAGSGLQIQQTLTNTGYNFETVTYNVTPIANGCPGDPTSFTISVFPVPDVYFTPPSQTICPLQTSNITNNSHVSGATYTWTATGSSLLVTGYSAGSGNLIQQTLNNTGYNIETVTYHVSPTANGCPGTSNNVIVNVNPEPAVTFTPCWDVITTTSAQPITLKGGTPLNGFYSGTGVSAGIFYPAVSGIGTFNITYSYINQYGCNGTASQAITVITPVFFNCGNNLTDIRDNKSYPTVLIGTQCWMAANLDYGQQLNASLTQRDNCVVEKYCYNNISANCTSNGGLYQWDELMQYNNIPASQGLCSPGWHVPTEANWNTLFNFYISNGFAGSPLKYMGYSGFNALLDGVRFKNVSWNFLNFATIFWSSTSHGPYKAWAHGMNEQNPSVSYYPSARSNAFPVRCIKD